MATASWSATIDGESGSSICPRNEMKAPCCTVTASRRASCGYDKQGPPRGPCGGNHRTPQDAPSSAVCCMKAASGLRGPRRQALWPGRDRCRARPQLPMPKAGQGGGGRTDRATLAALASPWAAWSRCWARWTTRAWRLKLRCASTSVPHESSPTRRWPRLAKGLPDKRAAQADKKGRVDLTDVALVTIDGEDARDFDDAVYCEPAKIGKSVGKAKAANGWRLHRGHCRRKPLRGNRASAIDVPTPTTAPPRVYFPRRVIPMLPEKLSNGLCSLNPEVERLSHGLRHAGRRPRATCMPTSSYPAVIRSATRASPTPRWRPSWPIRAAPEAARRQTAHSSPDRICTTCTRPLLKAQRACAARWTFETTETQIICDEKRPH